MSMRLNLHTLSLGTLVSLFGLATVAIAAPPPVERSGSSGNQPSAIVGPWGVGTASAKPTKPAQIKYAAKKKSAAKSEQPDSAAIAQAVRDFLSNNQALLRTAIIEILRSDAEIRNVLAPPSERTLAPQTPVASAPGKPLDQAQMEEIIRNYLLLHPEVLQEAIAELEKRQALAEAEKHKTAVKENAEVLYNSKRQVVLGNPQGDVTFVEFFDYNCAYCKRALSDMMELIKTDSKLKVVLKEFPVLGKGSMEAAQVAAAVRMQDKTGKKYLEFHQKLLLGRGQADRARALAVAKEIGLDMARLEKDIDSDEARATIEESLKLAEALGLNGTPSYVVGPNVVIGAVGAAALREKVNTARCGKATC
jgi:protein-disulfide isomerase